MKNPDAGKWEALAREQGYFPVVTHDGALQVAGSDVATFEFFATGEADVASPLSEVASILGREVPLTSALDFGCGVGRLTLALARRATSVTACDIAPTMLVHAGVNAKKAELHNITFMESEELLVSPDHQFTLICSLLVFQYVPRRTGYAIIRTLLRLLTFDGVALLHVMLAPRGEALRQLVRMSRARMSLNRRWPDTERSAPQSDGLQTYEYDARVVAMAIKAADARIVGRVPAPIGDKPGAVLIIRKASPAT